MLFVGALGSVIEAAEDKEKEKSKAQRSQRPLWMIRGGVGRPKGVLVIAGPNDKGTPHCLNSDTEAFLKKNLRDWEFAYDNKKKDNQIHLLFTLKSDEEKSVSAVGLMRWVIQALYQLKCKDNHKLKDACQPFLKSVWMKVVTKFSDLPFTLAAPLSVGPQPVAAPPSVGPVPVAAALPAGWQNMTSMQMAVLAQSLMNQVREVQQAMRDKIAQDEQAALPLPAVPYANVLSLPLAGAGGPQQAADATEEGLWHSADEDDSAGSLPLFPERMSPPVLPAGQAAGGSQQAAGGSQQAADAGATLQQMPDSDADRDPWSPSSSVFLNSAPASPRVLVAFSDESLASRQPSPQYTQPSTQYTQPSPPPRRSERTLTQLAQSGYDNECEQRTGVGEACPPECRCNNSVPTPENAPVQTTNGLHGKELKATRYIAVGTTLAMFGATRAVKTHAQGVDTLREIIRCMKSHTPIAYLLYTLEKNVDDRGPFIFVPPEDMESLREQKFGPLCKKIEKAACSPWGNGQYANHTCCREHQNAELVATIVAINGEDVPVVVVKAIKEIEPDETIWVRYAEKRDDLPFNCACCVCVKACPGEAPLSRAEGKQPVSEVAVRANKRKWDNGSAAKQSQGASSRRLGTVWGLPGCESKWNSNISCDCYYVGRECLNAPSSNVEVRPTQGGLGVFATKPLPAGKVLCFFAGSCVDERTPAVLREVMRALDDASTDDYSIRHGRKCVCVPPQSICNLSPSMQEKLKKNCYTTPDGFPFVAHYVNHTCRDPSGYYCWIRAEVTHNGNRISAQLCAVVALRDIEEGEEIFTTYYTDVEENGTPFVCNCGKCPNLSRAAGPSVHGN